MKSKRSKIMLALAFVCIFAVTFSAFNLIFANKRSARAEDTDAFVKTAVQTTNAVVLTPTAGGGVTATGNQTNDRTVVVFDHAISLGSKINFTVKINADVTDTGKNDALKTSVYSALYFAQATKTEDGFSATDFYFNRTTGNGMRLHLFTNSGDLKPQDRAMINIGTFTKKDIVNGDSVWGQLGDGANDLGWAFVNGKPIDVEIGKEKVGGVDKIYIQFTVDRRPGRPNLTVYKIPVNRSDLVATENDDGYYIAFEAANLHATERAVSVELSEITHVETGLIVTPESVFLKPTQTETLIVTDKATQQVLTTGLTFASDNTSVAKVDSAGVITAVGAGSAKITVTTADDEGEAYVTVADNITLSTQSLELFTGQSATLIATTNPSGLPVIWESDNDQVATVNDGIITATGVGTANVKATIRNFEIGDLEISASAAVTVTEYVKPADIHGDDFDVVYSDGIIIGGTGGAYSEGVYTYSGTTQSGYSYLVLDDGLLFDNPVYFDFINTYDVSNTNDGNHMNRFFGISIVQGDRALLEAPDYVLGTDHGLQINFSANGGWWAWGGKFFMNYRTAVSGTVTSARTPENTGSLTGTDRFANAFCRAFADGMRIQVKIWKADDKLNVSFTPVFIEGEILTGEENLTYPNGGQHDYVGPYTLTFDYADVATGEGRFAVAVGTGNTVSGTVANMNYRIENFDKGTLYGVSLSRESVMLKTGGEHTLIATCNPATYIPADTEWVSSDPTVATVSANGVITAVAGGRTVITYTADGLSATCAVTVVQSLSVNSNSVSLKIGETFKIVATTVPEDIEILYASGNRNIAEVAADGTITAVAEGEVTIYVRAGGELFSEEITVTVTRETAPPTEEPTPSSCAGCSDSASTGIMGFALLGVALLGALLIIGIKRKAGKR